VAKDYPKFEVCLLCFLKKLGAHQDSWTEFVSGKQADTNRSSNIINTIMTIIENHPKFEICAYSVPSSNWVYTSIVRQDLQVENRLILKYN
jgi:hypothetical protein